MLATKHLYKRFFGGVFCAGRGNNAVNPRERDEIPSMIYHFSFKSLLSKGIQQSNLISPVRTKNFSGFSFEAKKNKHRGSLNLLLDSIYI